MQLSKIGIDLLDDAPRNANKMTEAKYAGLKESIKRVGFTQPILVTDTANGRFEIVDGHHRRDAMRDLGHADIPVVILQPGEDPRLVALAMNRLRGDTDLAVAGMMIDEMLDEGLEIPDLAISGFTEKELRDLVDALNTPEPSLDDVSGAELPEEVGTPVARPFLLELTFKSKQDLAAAKKALKKAAGKGGDLADGLLRLVEAS